MKNLKHTSLALLSTLIMTTQSIVADLLTEVQLHATLGVITNFILDDSGISHNGTSYGTVTSPYTGRVWLDRNLGASKVCASLDDTSCYGGYYQWGRNTDGHEKSTSNDTPTLATNVTNVGHGDFITSTPPVVDWTSVDLAGLERSSNWMITDGSSVCPVDFRIPTNAELKAELFDVGSSEISNNADAFNSFLKFPSAGYRDPFNGAMVNVSSSGNVWLSSVNGSFSFLLEFSSVDADVSGAFFRAGGSSVRCIEKLKPEEHYHNGTVYGEVTSPYTGKIWLDRNLGANRVCTSFNDIECYGDYYQWGRNVDGHQDSTSIATTLTNEWATDVNDVGHNKFIKSNNTNHRDWATVDTSGSIRQVNWSKIDGTSVCPVGFRVPTIIELTAELLDAGSAQISNRNDAYNSFLKFPSSGVRQTNGSYASVGSAGTILSSTNSGYKDSTLYFQLTTAATQSTEGHAYGNTVRCLKD